MAEAQTYLSKCISQKRSIYSNRTVNYVIVLLELLTVLLEYIDLSVIPILISKNSYYYTNILPIMLALCSILSDTYYAHNYASIIGGSLLISLAANASSNLRSFTCWHCDTLTLAKFDQLLRCIIYVHKLITVIIY